MANNLSNYAQNAMLNSLLGKTSSFGALASAPSLYIALCTAAPTNANTGSTITEANYTGYARVNLTGGSNWSAPSGNSPAACTNSGTISFPACTGGSSTVTDFAICDAASGGNMILWGALAASLAISNGITPSFAAGALSIQDD